MKTLTLKELGNKLPVQLEDGSRPSFRFRTWRMLEEKQIGQIKQKYPHLGRFVREVFDLMLSEWGGKEWKSIELNQRKLLLSGLPWASIFYMYVYLRVDALGTKMKMSKFDCPSCGAPKTNFIADLDSMEIRCHGMGEDKEEEDDLLIDMDLDIDEQDKKEKPEEENIRETTYILKKPFEFGEITVTGIRFGFTPWRAMEMIKQHDRNEGSIKAAMMKASLLGAVTKENPKVDLEKGKVLAMLSKRDIEGYYDALDEFNGGPTLSIETKCEACDHEFKAPMNWTYDYFFGNSSL